MRVNLISRLSCDVVQLLNVSSISFVESFNLSRSCPSSHSFILRFVFIDGSSTDYSASDFFIAGVHSI